MLDALAEDLERRSERYGGISAPFHFAIARRTDM